MGLFDTPVWGFLNTIVFNWEFLRVQIGDFYILIMGVFFNASAWGSLRLQLGDFLMLQLGVF